MARLGEAYVRVRADLKDYDADLDKALKNSTDKFEKALNDSLGRRVGKNLGDGVSAELDASLKASTRAFVEDFASQSREAGRRGGREVRGGLLGSMTGLSTSIGGLVTDGLSGLPPQVRAILGTVIAGATIPLGAFLASSISTGIALGVAGLGVALASQFDVVQESAKEFGTGLRATLVEASRPFIDPILEALSRADAFLGSITGRLSSTFASASQFIEPLTTGVLALIDSTTRGLEYLVANSGGLVDALGQGFFVLGDAIEESLYILGSLGEDGEQALRDLIFAVSDLIVFSANLLAATVKTYNIFRDFVQSTDGLSESIRVLFPLLALLKLGFDNADEAAAKSERSFVQYGETTARFGQIQRASIVLTDEQTKALKDQAKAIDDARRAQFRAIDSTLSYLDSLSNLTKTLKANRGAFGFESEKGRESVRDLGTALKEAEDRAKDLYTTGKLTSEQAQVLYAQEREQIYKNAAAYGVTKERIDAIFGGISAILNLPPIDDKFKLLASGITAAQEAARELRKEIQRGGFTPPSVRAGVGGRPLPGYADGAIVDREHVATVGEGNRREVILPLSNPRRTRELAQQSGLMGILGGGGVQTVNVYVGNEQLDSRMFRVARANGQAQARMMTMTPRMA